jgi:hypothetical protein
LKTIWICDNAAAAAEPSLITLVGFCGFALSSSRF